MVTARTTTAPVITPRALKWECASTKSRTGWDMHSLYGVMEDVETVAVFSKEAQGAVLEEMLGDRGWAQRHGDEGGRGDADDAEPQGGNEEVGLPDEAMIDGGNADKDCCSQGEDARSEVEDTLPG